MHKHAGHHDHHHDHSHGVIDHSITTSNRGLWAIKWSFVILCATSVLQLSIFYLSNSVALLADAIHNVGDAATAVPLAIAFSLAKLKPSRKFTYGLGRVEDLAGVVVVLTVCGSGVIAGYEAIHRFIHPSPVSHLPAVMIAAIIAFIGNESVAVLRIRVGKEIKSAALIADGYHARTDGFISLAVLAGAIGLALGYPLADPIAGLLITCTIAKIVWDSAKTVFFRMLDGIEPELIDELKHAASAVPGVLGVTGIRARWIGHQVHADLNIDVDPNISVAQGHDIAEAVRQRIQSQMPHLCHLAIHVEPK